MRKPIALGFIVGAYRRTRDFLVKLPCRFRRVFDKDKPAEQRGMFVIFHGRAGSFPRTWVRPVVRDGADLYAELVYSEAAHGHVDFVECVDERGRRIATDTTGQSVLGGDVVRWSPEPRG